MGRNKALLITKWQEWPDKFSNENIARQRKVTIKLRDTQKNLLLKQVDCNTGNMILKKQSFKLIIFLIVSTQPLYVSDNKQFAWRLSNKRITYIR